MRKYKNPSYLQTHHDKTLARRILSAGRLLEKCNLCPRQCGTNRVEGQLGLCRTGAKARVASFGPHFGEESPLVGQNGSGTIFFAGCNLHCIFCQNNDISHINKNGDSSSQAVNDHQLAEIMVHLQDQGCHNINLVTPSHVVPQILAALPFAIERGLHVPLIYNTGGYDHVDTLHLLEGVVDIYMPDCKFISSGIAQKFAAAPDYPQVMTKAVQEMFNQVGNLVIDAHGIAVHGLLVRHLIMPGLLDETDGILDFLAQKVSRKTYINLMDQYRPCHRAFGVPPINRALTGEEYRQAEKMAAHKGLNNLDQRDWQKIMQFLGQ